MSRITMALARTTPGADLLLGAAIAAMVLAAGLTGLGPSGPDDKPLDLGAVALVALLVLAMAVRRRVPVATLVAANAVTVAWYVVGYHGRLVTLAPLIACYTLAAHRGWRWGVAGGLFTVAATAVTVRVAFDTPWISDPVFNATLLQFATVTLGAAVHSHRAYAASAREQAEHVAEARAEQARRQAAEERLEISRELHDVFGHTMAAISVQAGVAVHVMQRKPEQAAHALTTIKRISDEGLAEVQVLLGVMRAPSVRTPTAPGGLAHLDKLVDVTRAAGVAVDLVVRGDGSAVPATVDLAAFRIVQESLTNIRRHAQATSVVVHLDYGPDALELSIQDNGTGGAASSTTPAGGHGIDGMRHRAAAVGGSLTAGPCPGGGFEVRCALPTKKAENEP